MNPLKGHAIGVGVVMFIMFVGGCATTVDRRVSMTPPTVAFDRGLAMYYGFDYDAQGSEGYFGSFFRMRCVCIGLRRRFHRRPGDQELEDQKTKYLLAS